MIAIVSLKVDQVGMTIPLNGSVLALAACSTPLHHKDGDMPNEPINLTPQDIARFESKFVKTDGCWNWMGARCRDGYGNFRLGNRTVGAQRITYMVYVGPIPDGLCVLHRCDNPACVNPAHLWLGTHTDNMRDSVSKGRFTRAHGERNGNVKLTIEKVLEIRELIARGQTRYSVARKFGASWSNINSIVRGKTWIQVTEPAERRTP